MPIEVESPEEIGYGSIRFNLTESSVRDRRFSELGVDLDGLVLGYLDHRGDPTMRAMVAADANASVTDQDGFPGLVALAEQGNWASSQTAHNDPCDPLHVLLMPGAAAALFCVHMALLGPGDELVVVRPNYGTNIETPRGLGAKVTLVDLNPDEGWLADPDALRAAVTGRTKLISITNPHNPTGAVVSERAIRQIVDLADEAGAWLLVDETYRDLSFDRPAPWAVTMSPRVISIASMSKAYGLPGIRQGWLICRDEALLGRLLALKEQMLICGSAVDEAIAATVYAQRATYLRDTAFTVLQHHEIVTRFVANHSDTLGLHAQRGGGVVAFPEIVDSAVDIDEFYRVLNETHRCYVGPGHWFEQPRRFFRLGFGWPTTNELTGGLDAIADALTATRR